MHPLFIYSLFIIVQDLKNNWELMQKAFLQLPMLTDTIPKILRKTKMEQELKQLEKDIALVESNPYIYIYEWIQFLIKKKLEINKKAAHLIYFNTFNHATNVECDSEICLRKYECPTCFFRESAEYSGSKGGADVNKNFKLGYLKYDHENCKVFYAFEIMY